MNARRSVWFMTLGLLVAVSLSLSGFAAGTLVVGVTQGPEHLDPALALAHAAMVFQYNICGYLVRTDAGLNLYPAIAESWEVDEAATQWTFHIRPGVKFHNGRELVAQDVKYSFERTMSEELASRYRGDFANVDSIEVLDQYTVVVHLKKPDADFARLMSDSNASAGAIVPQEAAEKPEFDMHPISAGPFMFESYTPGLETVIVRNPYYYVPDRPLLDKIIWRIVPDPSVRVNALITGDIDLTYGFAYERVEEIRGNPDLQLFMAPSVWNEILWFNFREPPFDSPYIRRAVAVALNYEELAAGAVGGVAVLNQSLISPIVAETYGIYSISFEQDLDFARRLLERAGVGEGETISAEIIVMPGYPEFERLALMIKDQLQAIGFDITYTPLELGEYFDRTSALDFQFLITGYSEGGSPDIELGRYHHPGSEWNLSGSLSYVLGRLLDEGRATVDPELRAKAYTGANAVLQDLCAWVTLYWRYQVIAARNEVKGFVASPQNVLFFRDVWVEE
ncbi:MAG: ABC transporter substrate-binding protein [Desulfobacteraceae bacterium]|nr:ABC transporter substrate-binding protein [Desulfobacteraceae bacterium]